MDAKSLLMRFLQRFSGRPVTKQDFVCAVEKYDQGYQATLSLPLMGDAMEFVGEIGASAKDAEKNAAQQALNNYAREVEAADVNYVTGKARKNAEKQAEKQVEESGLSKEELLQRELDKWKGRATQLERQVGELKQATKGVSKGAPMKGALVPQQPRVPPQQAVGKGPKVMPAGPFGNQASGKGMIRPSTSKGTVQPTSNKGSMGAAFAKGKYGMQTPEDLRMGRLANKGTAKGSFAGSLKGPAATAGKGKDGKMQAKNAAPAPGQDVQPARSQLNTFLQRFLGRPVVKADQEILVEKADDHQFQAHLTLRCLDDEVFVGEVAATEKEAAENAAAEALRHHAADVQALPPVEKKKKRKAEEERGEPQAGPMTQKSELNSMCMKLLKGPITKGEITYETSRAEDSTYQSVVTIQQLQDEMGGNIWTGEAGQSKQEAEHSAAGVALEALLATPEHVQTLEDRANEPPKKKLKGEGKGKGKDD